MRHWILSLTILAAPFGLAAADLPDTPAAGRLAEITALAGNATPARVADYIESAYTPDYAARLPLAQRIGLFMDWKARGGMNVVAVESSEPHRIQVIAEQPLTGERWMLGVQTTAESPHPVEALMVGRAPLPVPDPLPADEAAADALLEYTGRLADAGLFSGAVLIARHGEILGQRAWGVANRDFDAPNNLETRFNLGSLNKTWTAVAIARLVEDGKLSFDDPVAKFIDYPDAESAAKIRIEHLLTHTSGLGSYFTEEYDRTARKNLRTVDDFLALSADQELSFEPGEGWQYSNTGMMLAGRIIEIVSGQDYFDHIQERVLDPAGMTRSGCFELDRVNDNLAVGYATRWSVDGPEVVNNLFEHVVRGGPAGGCYATVGDLFRFAEALKAGRLVGPEMVAVLTTAKPELGSPHYGYGFGIAPERAVVGHSGGFLGISANLDIVMEPAGWVVVILANDENLRAPMVKARQLIGVDEGG